MSRHRVCTHVCQCVATWAGFFCSGGRWSVKNGVTHGWNAHCVCSARKFRLGSAMVWDISGFFYSLRQFTFQLHWFIPLWFIQATFQWRPTFLTWGSLILCEGGGWGQGFSARAWAGHVFLCEPRGCGHWSGVLCQQAQRNCPCSFLVLWVRQGL